MRIDKLTTQFQHALADAQSLALANDNQYIDPLHLLGALLDQADGSGRPLRKNRLQAEVAHERGGGYPARLSASPAPG